MSNTEQKLKDAAHDVKNAIKDTAHDVKNAVKDTTHDVKNKVQDADAAHDARNQVQDAAHDLKNAVQDAAHDARNKVQDAPTLLSPSAIVSQIKIRASRSGLEASAGFSSQRERPAAKASNPKDYLNIY
jgi:gas vesicle protein